MRSEGKEFPSTTPTHPRPGQSRTRYIGMTEGTGNNNNISNKVEVEEERGGG
jgi:hypothetical protein